MADGLFGPGIFGTGIDLNALDQDTAWKLGLFFGEQIRAAEERGYQRATTALREEAERRATSGQYGDGGYGISDAADYLESLTPKEETNGA